MRASQAQSYGLSAFLRRPQPRSKERDIERTRTPENPAMISGLSWQGALTADPPLRMSLIRGSPRDRSSAALSLDLLPGPGPEPTRHRTTACYTWGMSSQISEQPNLGPLTPDEQWILGVRLGTQRWMPAPELARRLRWSLGRVQEAPQGVRGWVYRLAGGSSSAHDDPAPPAVPPA